MSAVTVAAQGSSVPNVNARPAAANDKQTAPDEQSEFTSLLRKFGREPEAPVSTDGAGATNAPDAAPGTARVKGVLAGLLSKALATSGVAEPEDDELADAETQPPTKAHKGSQTASALAAAALFGQPLPQSAPMSVRSSDKDAAQASTAHPTIPQNDAAADVEAGLSAAAGVTANASNLIMPSEALPTASVAPPVVQVQVAGARTYLGLEGVVKRASKASSADATVARLGEAEKAGDAPATAPAVSATPAVSNALKHQASADGGGAANSSDTQRSLLKDTGSVAQAGNDAAAAFGAPVTLDDLADAIGDQVSSFTAPAKDDASASAPTLGASAVKEVQLNLNPADLGALSVRMRLAGGNLAVVIEVAKPDTLKLIDSKRDEIASRLTNVDASIASVVVKASDNGNSTDGANNAANPSSLSQGEAQSNASSGSPRQGADLRATTMAAARRAKLRSQTSRYLTALALAASLSSFATGRALAAPVCEEEMTRAAATNNIPLNVLYAVGLTETGDHGLLDPYDMDVDGRRVHSTSLPDALQKFSEERARQFIDIGCMQINQRWHGADFKSVADMFNPTLNVAYAAHFLKELKIKEGTWTMAVARYNAGPDNNAAQKKYVCAVIGNMVASGLGRWTPDAYNFCK